MGLCGLYGDCMVLYGCVGCRGRYGTVWGFMGLCGLINTNYRMGQ